MSKPDPNITANLLNTVLGKTSGSHGSEGSPARAAKIGHQDTKEDSPIPKGAKLASPKKATGPSHTRSCNRGK